MCRLTSWTTDSGSVASDSLAIDPTTAWPASNRTTDGVVGEPSAFGSTTGTPASLTCATTENVVPRSMPRAGGSANGHSRGLGDCRGSRQDGQQASRPVRADAPAAPLPVQQPRG